MAAPTYLEDLTDISTAESVTNWAEATATGWTAGANPIIEPDFFIQGSNCIAKYMTSGQVGLGGWLFNFGSGVTVPTDGAVFMWMMAQCPNNYDTYANGGQRFLIGNDLANFYYWVIDGKDTNPYGGWKCYPVNPAVTTGRTAVGSPSGAWQYFGGAVNQLATAKGGGGIDVIRYGRGELKIEFGSTGDGLATFSGAAAANDASAQRWGLLQAIQGGYLWQGLMLLGSATNAVDFRDSNTVILIAKNEHITANFNTIEIRNASSRVDWTNVIVQALGTVSKGRFIVTDNADVNFQSVQFIDMSTFSFLSATDMLDCVFQRCGQITAPGSNLSGSIVSSSTVATDASALLWNVNTDPGGKLDGMTFIKGANAHHAIRLGASGASDPINMSLAGIEFSGFNASDGQDDSALHLVDTGADRTWNINAVACIGTVSYKKARSGDTVNIINAVTVQLTGLKNPTEVRVYTQDGFGDNDVEIAGEDSVTDGDFQFSAESGEIVNIVIYSVGYLPADIYDFEVPADNASIPVSQVLDRQYLNP